MDPRLRVLMLLSNGFRPDPRVLKEARSLASDHHVTVLAHDRRGERSPVERRDGFEVRRLSRLLASSRAGSPSNRSRSNAVVDRRLLGLPLRLVRVLVRKLGLVRLLDHASFGLRSLPFARRGYDVVHCHDLDTLPAGVVLSRLLDARLVFDAHEDYPAKVRYHRGPVPGRLAASLERILLRMVDRVIVVGTIMARAYERRAPCPVEVVGNWVRLSDLPSTPEAVHERVLDARRDGRTVVSYLGGIARTRPLTPLVEACRERDDILCVLAGGRDTQAYSRELREATDELPNVLWLGWLDHRTLHAYFRFSDLIYYGLDPEVPNHAYSSSNTVFSALAASCPVITNDIGENARVVQEFEAGVVLEELTTSAVGRALDRLRRDDVHERAREGARRAAGMYGWDRAERTLRRLYRGLEDGGRR